MRLAKVIGAIVATRKDPNLVGMKLLVVQPLTPKRAPAGRPLVAVDSAGAGVGEDVFFVRGRERRHSPSTQWRYPPTPALLVSVDHWALEKTYSSED